MSDASNAGGMVPLPPPPPPPPPPPGSGVAPAASRQRPWWSTVDVLLSIPFVLVASVIGVVAATVASSLAGYDIGDDLELPAFGLFIAVLGQQLGQGLWPVVVSRWKGISVASDWRLRFDLKLTRVGVPRDIALGLGVAFACLLGAYLATEGMAALVGLDDPGDASNTSIISDNEGSPWLIGVVALVVIGAPLTEELLFRGLILRVFEQSFGQVAALVGSTLLFTLPHIQADATWRESLVLLSAIATIGLVLGIGALRFGRLGPSIIAHFAFNVIGTAGALAAT